MPDEDGLGVGDAPDPKDKRLRPTYDVLFVQDVGTEDVFLGTESAQVLCGEGFEWGCDVF